MLFFIGSDKMFSLEKINSFLCSELKEIDINVFESVTSTNTLLKEQGKSKNEWCTFVASSQTGGKGRLGRSFYSPKDTGVYLSVLLKPDLELEKVGLITTAAAVAVTRVLENSDSEKPQIKWVNDVFVNGKKVCGILCESVINSETKKLDFAVLGVGINLVKPKDDFPEAIKDIAGAVFENETENLKEKFIADFLNEFYYIYRELNLASFMNEYRKKCFCLGKEITVISGESKKKARAISIDENACLEVEFENGTRKFLSSGEISIKI